MIPGPACIDLVKRFEGCVLHAYPDPASGGDPWTIGWGHTGPEVHKGLVWTQAQADKALHDDLGKFADALDLLLGAAKTTANQFDALCSLVYNEGSAKIATSTLLKLHLAGNYDAAANQFQRWIYGGGKVQPGLITRRSAEATLYRTP